MQTPNLSVLNEAVFKTWLAAQPGHRAFDYCDPNDCFFATFIREVGCHPAPHCHAGSWREDSGIGANHPFPSWLYRLDVRVRDELPTLFDVDQVRELLKPKTFTVNVTRISTSTKTYEVLATSDDEAKSIAVDRAANEVFSEKDASYEAEVV